MCSTENVDDLISIVLGETITDHRVGHHILAPGHADVDLVNNKAIDRMPVEVSLRPAYLLPAFKNVMFIAGAHRP